MLIIVGERVLREGLIVIISQLGRLKLRISIWVKVFLIMGDLVHLEEILHSNSKVSLRVTN